LASPGDEGYCKEKPSRAAFSESLRGSKDSHEIAETEMAQAEQFFEVVENMVFVRSAPRKDALGVGILRKGTHIQVRGLRRKDDEGHTWVQLTEAEFWRSCEPEVGMDIKCGFALIDGTSLGLGLLLRGPLSDSELLPASTPTPEAVQKMVEERNRASEERQMVIDQRRMRDAEKRLEQERVERQTATAEALEKAKAQGEATSAIKRNQWAHTEGAAPPQGAILLRSTGRFINIKQSQDPNSQKVMRFECRAGMQFCIKSGSEWQGPQGGLWMEHATRPAWLLIEDANHGGTLLVNEADSADFATVTIDFLSTRGDIRVFEAFVNVKSSVKSLNSHLCSETGLKPKGTFLFTTRPPAQGMPKRQDMMQAHESLFSYDILPGTQVPLYLLYPFNFEGDYLGGAYLPEKK